MIGEKIQDAFNEQINAEMYSSYLYLSMAAKMEDQNLSGFANWFTVQAQEELIHAMKFYRHIIERGGRVKLKAIEEPPTEWDNPLAAFEAAYEHEVKVTGLINALVDLSHKEKDHAAANFLQWFIDEQVEEEASADENVQKLKMVGSDSSALYLLDKEVGARAPIFPDPTTVQD